MTTQRDEITLEPPTTCDTLLWDVWLSAFRFPALTVADELGLFPLLNEAPATLGEVADRLSLGPRATEAMLALLASLGFLAKHNDRFHLTDAARSFMLPDGPYYWGGMLHMFKGVPVTHAALLEAMRKDQPAAPDDGKALTELWETHEISAERATEFTRAMHSHSLPAAMGVARRGDFKGVRRLLDVAGGSGCFCIALAMRYPEMRFTVAELPVVCELAALYAATYGLSERIETAPLDMFRDPFPTGYEGVFFSNVLHDWGRRRCVHLLQRSFDALPSGGRIYLHEMLLADTADGPLAPAAFSMVMMLFTEGKQFTASELSAMLRDCGFVDVKVTPTYGYYSLVMAIKP